MLNKRPLYLLIVSPVLIAIQFVVGIVLVQKIIVVNNEQKINSKLETYLRNNMVYLINAETGQRGYLLTGDLKYLEPYNFAVEKTKENDLFLSSFASNDQIQQLAEIKQKGENKLRELALTIALAQSGKRDSAMIVIKENFGKLTMDSIRKITNEFLGKAVEIIMTDQE
ncbi:MAG: putative rane associated signaling protein family protein, partial [Bacteroidota bacterium]|nr:putative rane associated signaling protein family protein [Bacteroidota bacterium]